MADCRGRADLYERCNSVSIGRHRIRGFTMVELLVVLAIVAIMTSLAIPVAIRWGATGSDQLGTATRELHSLLRAAQMHAATYRVNAGVAYYVERVQDSVTGEEVSVATAYAVVYSKPGSDDYHFLPDSDGQFKSFPEGIGLLLFYPESTYPGLGMREITLWTETVENGFDHNVSSVFPAHVFKPASVLDTSGGRERYEVFIGPMPTEGAELRLINPNDEVLVYPDDSSNLMGSRIELYRSTGRVKVAS